MVSGKIVTDSDGERKSVEINPCNMVIACGIKKVDETENEMTVGYQNVRAGGGGLSKYVFIDTLSRWIIDVVAEAGDSPGEAAALLELFFTMVNRGKKARLKELKKQITGKEG